MLRAMPDPTRSEWIVAKTEAVTPHAMVTCQSCHAAEGSTRTSDVLMPSRAVCATCHAPGGGGPAPGAGRAESRCFECHAYHGWTTRHSVTPSYSLTDFK